jgi:hypothetical protein
MARFPIKDPTALLQHFWDEFSIRDDYSQEEMLAMMKVYQFFILTELSFNLHTYNGGIRKGLPAGSHILSALGKALH